MRQIYLHLKRFDVPVELGGVNRLAPAKDWGAAVADGTEKVRLSEEYLEIIRLYLGE